MADVLPERAAGLNRWDAAIVGYAALAALARPLTLPAVVAVLLPGLALLTLAARRPARPVRPVRPRAPAVILWTAMTLLVVGWEATAWVWGNDYEHPTLSLLLDPVLDTYPGRVVGWVGWLAAGRWLVTR